MADFAEGTAETAWIEIHSENFFAPGGPRLAQLEAARAHYPLSLHGVGLSLGSAGGIDEAHLSRLKQLADRFEPALISEHIAFSMAEGVYLNDLLPLPYTEEALEALARNVDRMQTALGRRVLVENPSAYVTFADTTLSEWDFISALIDSTGCGLLLDINNVYVSAENNGFKALDYLKAIPADAVEEIHLAGHLVEGADEDRVLIDTHSTRISEPVWALYEKAIAQMGPRPTLIEWDFDLPPLSTLLGEARIAQSRLDRLCPAPEATHA